MRKTWFLKGAHSLEGEAHKTVYFHTTGMKRVQSNYKPCTEGKGLGKLHRGHRFTWALKEEKDFSRWRGERCFSPPRLRSLRAKLISYLSTCSWDFPGGPVVKNLSCNAGHAGSIPGWGTNIPHAAGQLSPAPQLQSLRAPQLESPTCRKLQTPRALEPTRHN